MIADTALSLICLYLFVKPMTDYKNPPPEIKACLRRNLMSCLAVLSTSLVTMLCCALDSSGGWWLSTFATAYVAFDKFVDVVAVNIAFGDFRTKSAVAPKSDETNTSQEPSATLPST